MPGKQAEAPPGLQTRASSPADSLVVGREHHAERRRHGVERSVVVRDRLRVTGLELDLDAGLGGAFLRRLDQVGREIEAGHLGTALCRADGDFAGPGREVEPALARAGFKDTHQVVVRDRQVVGDVLVRTTPPHHALLGLQLFERHRSSSRFASRKNLTADEIER